VRTVVSTGNRHRIRNRRFSRRRQTDTGRRRAGVRQRVVRDQNRVLRRRRSPCDRPVGRRHGSERPGAFTYHGRSPLNIVVPFSDGGAWSWTGLRALRSDGRGQRGQQPVREPSDTERRHNRLGRDGRTLDAHVLRKFVGPAGKIRHTTH